MANSEGVSFMEKHTILEVVSITQKVKKRKVTEKLSSPQAIAKFIQREIGDLANEVLYVVCVNSQMEVNAVHTVSVGSLNASIVSVREIFKSAILSNSASIFIAHNHPSYQLSPSTEDLHVTKRVAEAGKVLGIELLDHLIVSPNDYYSIRDRHLHLF